MSLKQSNMSFWTLEIEEMFNFIEVNDYISLQIEVALGSLGSPRATRLVRPMIAMQFVVT